MEITKAKVGDRVKRSDYALRSKRDYWLSQGEYSRRNRAKEAYDTAVAERGTIAEKRGFFVAPSLYTVVAREGDVLQV